MHCSTSTAALALAWVTCLAAGNPLHHRDIPLDHRGIPFGSSFGIPGDNATFDYVIVGGGNAGLTLAARLAEQQSGSVAVIEAGGFYEISNGNLSQVPMGAGAFTGTAKNDWQPLIDWGYQTTPQIVCMKLQIQNRITR